MKVIDLTQTISEDMPLFPGTPTPKLNVKYTVEADGFREMEIALYSHMGTHLDTPAHVFCDGKALADYDVDQFCGPGLALDFSRMSGKVITLENFEKALQESLSQRQSRSNNSVGDGTEKNEKSFSTLEYLLFYTGWDKKWGSNSYLTGAPVLSEEVARHLTTLKLKGLGIDAISVDPMEGNMLVAHRILLENEIIIVENLKNLKELLGEDFEFYGLPLKIAGGEGSPIRGIAKIR